MANDLKVEYTISLNDLLSQSIKNSIRVADLLDKKIKGLGDTANKTSQNFSNSFKRASDSIRNVGTSTDSVNQKISKTSIGLSQLSGIVASIGFGALAKGVLDTGQEFENAQIQLNTLLQDSGKASVAFAKIKQDASSTPFDVQSLLQANTALISAGEDSEKARENILGLGNALAAMGKGSDELQRMSVNLNQIKSLGKASAMDIKQFVFAGIPIYKVLSQELGIAEDKVKDMDITYEQLTYALNQSAKAGHMFAGGFKNAMQSTSGYISNMGDVFKEVQDGLFKQFQPQINESVIGLTNFMKKLSTLTEYAKPLAIGIASITFALVAYKAAALLATYETGMLSAAMLANPFGIALGAVVLLVGGIISLNKHLEVTRERTSKIASATSYNSSLKSVHEYAKGVKKSGKGTYLSGYRQGLGIEEEKYLEKIKTLKDQKANANTLYSTPLERADQKLRIDRELQEAERTLSYIRAKKNAINNQSQYKLDNVNGKGLVPNLSAMNDKSTHLIAKAPQNFNINIGNLVQDLKVITENLSGMGGDQIRDAVGRILLGAVYDSQRIAGVQ